MLITILVFVLLLTPCVQAETYFVNVAAPLGLAEDTRGRGTTVIDFNCDGYEDIFVTAFNDQNFLYMNDPAQGGFVEVAQEYGLDYSGMYSATASIADVNNDMRPDILVSLCGGFDHPLLYINQGTFFDEIHEYAGLFYHNRGPSCSFVALRGKTMLDIYSSATFFAHNGDLTYTDITQRVGLSGIHDTYCPNFIDIDFDMDMDLFLALNHSTPGYLFRYVDSAYVDITNNNNLGYFPIGEGAAFGDCDNDGDPDLYISAGLSYPNSLFENDGTGYFIDRSEYSGTNSSRYCRAGVWGDVNHDGFLDLFVVSGTLDHMYINLSNGVFEDQAASMGIVENIEQFSAVMFDYDNDGDLDIFTPGINGALSIMYQNQTNDDNWLKFRIVGGPRNRSAIGAKVFLFRAGHLWDPEHLLGSRYVQALSGELSQSSQIVHFGVPQDGPFDVGALFIEENPGVIYGVSKGTMHDIYAGQIVEVDSEGNSSVVPRNFDFEISCYPIPTNSRISIKVTLAEKRNVKLGVYNICGQKVHDINFGSIEDSAIRSVDVSDLASGVYFVKLADSKAVASSRFMVLK
jgi:hypothetical protein